MIQPDPDQPPPDGRSPEGSVAIHSTASALPDQLRSQMAIALDVDDLVVATRLARDLQPWFGIAKVGFELYSAAGPDAIATFNDLGMDVFCDLKLFDIPTTVGRAATVLGALGTRYLNFHGAGGVAMLRAGAEGLRAGAASADLSPPVPLVVTVLTSEPDASEHLLRQRVTTGLDAGCNGFVCAVDDIPTIRELAPAATLVTPGIRPLGAPVDDQGRVATPRAALDAGANILVIGRPVTRADDPVAAAEAMFASLA